MAFYVRTGNGGADPDVSIRDLGITIVSGVSWTELTAYNGTNFGTGGFAPEELSNSEDLYDLISASSLEASTDGTTNNISASEYTPALPLIDAIINADGGINLEDSRLVLPTYLDPASLTNPLPREGEIVYDRDDGYIVFYDGSVWQVVGSEPGGAGDGYVRKLDDLSDVDVTTTPPFVGALLGYDGVKWVPLEGTTMYNKEIDELTDGTLYVGEALPGTATSAALWRIQRIIFTKIGNTEDVSITWADGDALFNNIWDNRLSLSYS